MTQNLDVYLKSVASFVNDDDKLVTYKWLSKELEIHVNFAKEILQKYYDQNHDKIDATFLIKGELKDDTLRMEVVRASDLETAKQKFSNLHFQHIYSVQKTLPDIQLLAHAGDGDVRFSAIKLEKNPLRDKSNTPKIAISEDPTSTKKTESKIDKNKIEEAPKPKVEEKIKDSEIKDKEPIKNLKAENTKSNAKNTKKSVQSAQTGFNNLFGKVANQKKPIEKKNVNPTQAKKSTSPVKNEIITDKPKSEESAMSSTKVKASTSSKTQSKKRTRSPLKKEIVNKRKRIVAVSDSSDDEEIKSDHSESEEEPEEIVEAPQKTSRKLPSPEPVKSSNGKVKIRKVISQSYEDDGDFILTKQVTVTEEVDAEPEPAPKPKKVEQPTKKKQANILHFFKRS